MAQGADLDTAQLMPLLLTVSCFSKIQTSFTFLVPAHPGSPGKRAINRVCVCVCVSGMACNNLKVELENVNCQHVNDRLFRLCDQLKQALNSCWNMISQEVISGYIGFNDVWSDAGTSNR